MSETRSPNVGKRERLTVEVNTSNGKRFTFDVGNIITILIVLASLVGTWATMGSQVAENTKDIAQLDTRLTAVTELCRDNAAALRAVSVAIDKNEAAIQGLRTGWNDYVSGQNTLMAELKAGVAGIQAQLYEMSKQLDKLSK